MKNFFLSKTKQNIDLPYSAVTVYWLHILQCSDSTIIPVSFTFDRDCILASHFTVQWLYLSNLIVYSDYKKNCILIVSPHFTVNHADLGCITSVNLQCFSLLELQISTVLVQIWINCLSYLQWFKLQYTVFVSCLHYFQWLSVAPNFNSDCIFSPQFTVIKPCSTI